MQNKANLQELFLLRARRDRIPVTMFLMNGFQMRGIITGFDAFAVILDSDGRQQMIYKHAISTIAPSRPVDLSDERPERFDRDAPERSDRYGTDRYARYPSDRFSQDRALYNNTPDRFSREQDRAEAGRFPRNPDREPARFASEQDRAEMGRFSRNPDREESDHFSRDQEERFLPSERDAAPERDDPETDGQDSDGETRWPDRSLF